MQPLPGTPEGFLKTGIVMSNPKNLLIYFYQNYTIIPEDGVRSGCTGLQVHPWYFEKLKS